MMTFEVPIKTGPGPPSVTSPPPFRSSIGSTVLIMFLATTWSCIGDSELFNQRSFSLALKTREALHNTNAIAMKTLFMAISFLI
jgi:hypothetical protein